MQPDLRTIAELEKQASFQLTSVLLSLGNSEG